MEEKEDRTLQNRKIELLSRISSQLDTLTFIVILFTLIYTTVVVVSLIKK